MNMIIPVLGDLDRGKVESLFTQQTRSYFGISTEIPESIFATSSPTNDYSLVVMEDVPNDFLLREELRYPSVAEVLWAIGQMNRQLFRVVYYSKKPVRFLHMGLRGSSHRFHMFPNTYAKQIVLSFSAKTNQYEVGVVDHRAPYEGYRLVFINR